MSRHSKNSSVTTRNIAEDTSNAQENTVLEAIEAHDKVALELTPTLSTMLDRVTFTVEDNFLTLTDGRKVQFKALLPARVSDSGKALPATEHSLYNGEIVGSNKVKLLLFLSQSTSTDAQPVTLDDSVLEISRLQPAPKVLSVDKQLTTLKKAADAGSMSKEQIATLLALAAKYQSA